MNYIIKHFIEGELETNCFLLICKETNKAAIIDLGAEDKNVIDFIRKEKLDLEFIINTHGHADHIAGNNYLKKNFPNAKILIHPQDASHLTDPLKNLSYFCGKKIVSPAADQLINENDIINFGKIKLKVLHTPGHTIGGLSLTLDEKHVFCGDTLFKQSIGRTDFPDGSYDDLIKSIKNKLFILPDNYIAYPGHGEFTTIKQEKLNNPFLK